ncbi:MAG: YCF48-related protein [Verrucomicrobia bacterium]|nr:YCF48-related protein [Verrucomicrobiota bacterium]
MIRLPFLSLVLMAAVFAADAPPRVLLLDGATAGSDLVVVGERGTILRSTDNATSWQPATSPGTATLTGIAFAPGAALGWAVGHDALILSTTDAGRTWRKQWQGENLADSFLDVLALDARRVIAVGAYGLFVASSDGGQTWSRRKIMEDDFHLNRISRGPTGTLYLAGEHGTLLRSSDDGATWARIPAAYEGSFYGVLPLDQRTLLAHGLRGHVFRSQDDGATWTPVPAPQPVLLAASVKLKNTLVLLAGDARALLVSRDRGQTLAPWTAPIITAVAELIETPDGRVLALGEAGATLLPTPP